MSEIILAQLIDPFRIILLGGLVYTMMRTRGQTGTIVPLLAGIVFVAALIPSTLGRTPEADFPAEVMTGLISNAIITAVIFAGFLLFQRLRSK